MTMTGHQAPPEPPSSLLPLPDPIGLANTQLCGRSCLWCCVTLPADAIDLGERQTPDGTAWFPRSCRTCTRARVNDALRAHKAFCELCIEVDIPCATRDGLRALAHGGAR